MKKSVIKISDAIALIGLEEEIRNYSFFAWIRNGIIKKYKISMPDLIKGKKYNMVEARMIIFYLLKKHTTYNYRGIALLFEIKNHSLVHRAVKNLENFIITNKRRKMLSVISCFEANSSLPMKQPLAPCN